MKRTVIVLIALLLGIYANAQTWNCGYPNAADVVATLSNDTLYVRGMGDMANYSISSPQAPWQPQWLSIKTVIIEEGVTNIGTVAFYNCDRMTSVVIPNSVTAIKNSAFFSCNDLPSIVIPASVQSIEGQAFAYTYNLKDVKILSSTPLSITGGTFYNQSQAALTVPCGSLEAYQNAPVWQDFGTIEEEECPSKAGVSHVKANFSCPGKVTVTYDLGTNYATDVTLYYSPDGGKTWLIAQTVSGDLLNQESGAGKTITWDNVADRVRWGKFKLKVDVPKVEPICECTVNSSLPVGKLTFLCYNLGANPDMTIEQQMAYTPTDDTDATVYGDLYQWGRNTDGHEKRTSGTTTTISNTDTPGHSNFITFPSAPYDWRSPRNNDLWGANKTPNDPCPEGWRIPTEAELSSIWGGTNTRVWNATGTPGYKLSPDGGATYTLFLPITGSRSGINGALSGAVAGQYWSSGVVASNSYYLEFYSGNVRIPLDSGGRTNGRSCRCVKEY